MFRISAALTAIVHLVYLCSALALAIMTFSGCQAIPPAPEVATSQKPILSLGAKGESVKILQAGLKKLGFAINSVDGDFGPRTEAAVEAFQKSKGLSPSGVVETMTWAALDKALAAISTPPPVTAPVVVSGWPKSWDDAVVSSVTKSQLSLETWQVSQYCPKWGSLSEDSRRQFWADFWWAVAKFESSRNPKAMFWEKTMPHDDVTGELTISEGLLQLSYQDEIWAKCGFNYAADRSKHLDDLKRRPTGKQSWQSVHEKTINDPARNLVCGNKIADFRFNHRQIKGKSAYDMLKGYWAVIRDKSPDVIAEMKKRNQSCF